MNTQLLTELTLLGALFIATAVVLFLFRHSEASITKKMEKFLTGLLGGFLLMAGTVKFFDPFTAMFASQIALSDLPFPLLAKWAGQLGEISAGVMLLMVLFAGKKLSSAVADNFFFAASLLATVIMVVAVYVHLLPGVPAEVLPLQSKPPVLTLIILFLIGLNAYLRNTNRHHGKQGVVLE